MKSLIGLAIGALLYGLTGEACAQDIKGVRLSLEGNLASFEMASVEGTSAARTSLGPLSPGFGVGIGGGVSDTLVLGARFLAMSTNVGAAGASSDATTLQALPYLEWVFLPAAPVRPFFGISSGFTSTTVEGLNVEALLYGGSVGVHGFIAEGVSLDSALSLHGFQGAVGPLEQSGFAAQLSFGISAWFTKSRRKPEESPFDVRGESSRTPAPRPAFPSELPQAESAASEVSAQMQISDGETVLLSGAPSANGDEVTVSVSSPQPAVSDCRDLAFIVGGTEWPFSGATPRRRAFSGGVVTGTVDVSSAIRATKLDRDVALRACELTLTLSEHNRTVLKTFLQRFRRYAREHGTWSLDGPNPAPAHNESESSADDVAPDANGAADASTQGPSDPASGAANNE